MTCACTCIYTCTLAKIVFYILLASCSYDIGSGSYSDSKFNYTISELFMLVILTLSGIYVRVVNRQPQQKLGANGRDDGPLVSLFLF